MTGPQRQEKPALMDYEGSQYRTDFWEGQGREYEDAAERIALRRLLPPRSARMIELGAGFGRLADLYAGYQQVVLLDYSRSLLEDAQRRWGSDPRFLFVVGNIYSLPFAQGAFDTVAMVRVLHHLTQPLSALREIRRLLVGSGTLVLEYANKRNLKVILRYLARRQGPNPFTLDPWEFVPLNFDFHPRYVESLLREVGLQPQSWRSVSLFRLALLKRAVPPRALAALDGLLQVPTAPLRLGPSIFLRAQAQGPAAPVAADWWRCPECSGRLEEAGEFLVCQGCGQRWSRRGGIYDFKTPA